MSDRTFQEKWSYWSSLPRLLTAGGTGNVPDWEQPPLSQEVGAPTHYHPEIEDEGYISGPWFRFNEITETNPLRIARINSGVCGWPMQMGQCGHAFIDNKGLFNHALEAHLDSNKRLLADIGPEPIEGSSERRVMEEGLKGYVKGRLWQQTKFTTDLAIANSRPLHTPCVLYDIVQDCDEERPIGSDGYGRRGEAGRLLIRSTQEFDVGI